LNNRGRLRVVGGLSITLAIAIHRHVILAITIVARPILTLPVLTLPVLTWPVLALAITAATLEAARAPALTTFARTMRIIATTIRSARLMALLTIALVAITLVTPVLVAPVLLTSTLVAPIMIAPAVIPVATTIVLIVIAVERIVLVVGRGIVAICRRFATLLDIAWHRLAHGTGRGGIQRCRQALADILDVDLGDRQVAPTDTGTLTCGLGRDHAIIVLSMLEIIFRRDTIADDARITGHLQIFFENLMGIAANPNLWAATVDSLIALTHPPAVLPATATAMGFTLAASATTANIVALFHHNVTSSFR
jgi:hypothetical protein